MKYTEMLQLTDAQIKEAYWTARTAAATSAEFAAAGFSYNGKHPKARRLASSVFYHQRQMDMLVSIARKRGFSVLEVK